MRILLHQGHSAEPLVGERDGKTTKMPISKMCTGDNNNKTDLTLSMESVQIHVYLAVAYRSVLTRRFA